jgi:hypothetical protein
MKKSIAIATFVVIGAGATSVAALPSPYQGSDTLFNVTTQAIAAAGLTPTGAYVGGGSGNAAAAMSNAATIVVATQQTGPMSRMIKSEADVCNGFLGGTSGSTDTNASGIVIGLDAVDVLSSTSAGASSACNSTPDAGATVPGVGLVYSSTTLLGTGPTDIFADTATVGGAPVKQTWKWALAMIYGGLDISAAAGTPAATANCASTSRANLVANWSNLFQNGCANGASSICGAGTAPNGALWHAYRRDDTSGTSDVFASILGLSPSTSNSSLNGFGASPYCNAMNWDSTSGNSSCGYGPHDQFTGPGGVVDPLSTYNGSTLTTPGSGNHRMPPPNTWGAAPNPGKTTTKVAWDVYPTQFQDNDPIRRPCQGAKTNKATIAGEEVCNIDGALGLVLPMVDSDWIPKGNLGPQFPTNACTTFVVGAAANVFTCAPEGLFHSGECPNGDQLFGTGCLVPIDGKNGTSQCVSSLATVTALQVRNLGSPDGRIYNEQFRDGTVSDGSVGYLNYSIAALGTTVNFTAAYNRIHQVETMWGGAAGTTACQLEDMTDQIGCLTQADPCSIGYAGDGSKEWYSHTGACAANGGINCPTAPSIDALRVAQTYPQTSTVQLLGKAGEYQLSRKLYFSSLVGFANVADTTGDPTATDELTLAKDEATPSFINPILTANDFFTLGTQSPTGTDTQFCEDFNEQTVCGAASNSNGCAGNPSGVPTVGTTCGNGTVEAYEECDGTVNAGTGGCSKTCRCNLDFNESTGACN